MKKVIPVTSSSMPNFDEYIEEIRDLWDSKWLTNRGAKHKKLEESLIEYLGVENVGLYTNGHLALEHALDALDLKGEVITTPFTFVSTTHAILRNGLTPVFCDINPDDFTIDVTKIEDLITEKTSAIMPVHVYGNVCDVYEIERIAQKYNLNVIYDAAHAFGVTVDGVGIGNFGDMSMFSFHATKVFNTIEGGALTFKNQQLGNLLNYLKNFGITGQERVDYIGGNAKMSEFQAAMGLCNLKDIAQNIEKRKKIVEHYRKNLSDVKGIKLLSDQKNVIHNYSYFPVVFDGYEYKRDEVFNHLNENGIFSRKYFYPIMSELDCYKKTYDSNKTPIAKDISEKVLTLPLYPDLTHEEVDRICRVILEMNEIKIQRPKYEFKKKILHIETVGNKTS